MTPKVSWFHKFQSSEMKTSFIELAQQYKIKFKIRLQIYQPLTGIWPLTNTFHHDIPFYFICARASYELTADLGHNNAHLRLTPALGNCLFKWGPFPAGPWEGGERSTLIHHSVAQPPQEVVNIVDLWNGHSCLGCTGWRFRGDMENMSHRFITEGDISQSVDPLISQSVAPRVCSVPAGFSLKFLSNREWKTVISHQTNPER